MQGALAAARADGSLTNGELRYPSRSDRTRDNGTHNLVVVGSSPTHPTSLYRSMGKVVGFGHSLSSKCSDEHLSTNGATALSTHVGAPAQDLLRWRPNDE